jgi:hypothetical protein
MKFLKIFLLSLVVILVVIRLMLPYYLLHYVERQINKIPEYRCKIADLNMNLWRGSYTLIHFQLWKITKNIPVPFFESEKIDFSVQWTTILKGKLVAKIMMDHPIINFVTDSNGGNEQMTIDEHWVDIVKSLFPLNINKLETNNGEVYFRSYHGNPPFKTYIKDVHFTLENIQNAQKEKKLLPSTYEFSGHPMGGGDMKVSGRFNPFDKQPTFYLKGEMNSLNVIQVANLLKHYTDIDVTNGTFSLYGEFTAANGEIKGYAKPFFKNLKIGDAKKESLPGVIVNGLAAVAAKILENPQKKTVATKIKIEGRIDDPNSSIFSIIGYLLHHAFINALVPGIDHSVTMQDVVYGKHRQPKSSEQERIPEYRN